MIAPGGSLAGEVAFVIEREAEDSFRFCVISTDPNRGLDYHVSNAEQAPKIKYKTVLAVKDVTAKKIMDDAFWALLFKLALIQSKQNTPDKLYDLLIPFLVDKPLEQVADGKIISQRSFTNLVSFFRSLW